MNFDERRLDRMEAAARRTRPAQPGEPREGTDPPPFPDIVTYVADERYLGRVPLFPAQLTVLKAIFLDVESLTAVDMERIERWGAGFTLPDEDLVQLRYEGGYGTAPDLLERMQRCVAEGRPWMHEVVLVLGRRGSKGFLGAIAASYVLFWYVTHANVHEYFGISPTKTLTVDVFAASKQQARDNQFRDLSKLLESSPCFAPYWLDAGADRVRLCAHRQLVDGIKPEPQQALFEVHARDTSLSSTRGQASIIQLYDEMAFTDTSLGSRTSAELMYDSATPATKTFGAHSFSYQASSPWTMTGKFYANHQRGLEVNPATLEAVAPEMFTLQAPSWDLYEGFEATQTGQLEMAPGGPLFVPLSKSLMPYDEIIRARDVNPASFDTEYGAQYSASLDAYLPLDLVNAVFGPFNGELLTMQTYGQLNINYEAHADPARTNNRFGFAIAHAEPDGTDYPDIVFDVFDAWDPRKSPKRVLDYPQIEAELLGYLDRFPSIANFTFDQYNSASFVDRLSAHARQPNRPVHTNVYVVYATRDHNREVYELLKKLILMGKIHAPTYETARLELLFLRDVNGRVDHPTLGDVTSKDLADCMAEVVWRLYNNYTQTHKDLAIRPRGSRPGGFPVNEYADQLGRGASSETEHNPARGRNIPNWIRRRHGLQ